MNWFHFITVFAVVCLYSITSFADDNSACSQAINCQQNCCCSSYPKTLFNWSGACCREIEADEEDIIVTDRPDFTEASSTVGLGRVQIETGYTFTYDDADDIQLNGHSYPETLFRIGMFREWFELRIAYNFLNEQTDDPLLGRSRIRGSDDLYLGAKFALTEQCGILPEMVIMPQTFVPTGSDSFTNDEWLPGVNWLYSWEVNETLSIAGSTQINRVRDATGHFYMETAQSAAVGVGITDALSFYTEYFGFYPTSSVEAGVGPEHYLNGGFAYLVSNDIQLDIRAGMGLNRNADDFFSGAGISVRF